MKTKHLKETNILVVMPKAIYYAIITKIRIRPIMVKGAALKYDCKYSSYKIVEKKNRLF